MIFLPDAENRTHRIFIRLDKTTERDGRTDLPYLLHRSTLRATRTRCKNGNYDSMRLVRTRVKYTIGGVFVFMQ